MGYRDRIHQKFQAGTPTEALPILPKIISDSFDSAQVGERSQNSPPASLGTGGSVTASRWWLIHYSDRDPAEVACSPEATHAEMMASFPDAVAAEPFAPAIRQPSAPLTANDERAIRAWLAAINETDEVIIGDVLTVCAADPETPAYYLGRAAEHRQGVGG